MSHLSSVNAPTMSVITGDLVALLVIHSLSDILILDRLSQSLAVFLFFLQWHEASLRRWIQRRSIHRSLWRSVASTDRRPMSLCLGVWGYGAGKAALKCPCSAGWSLEMESSFLLGQWGLGRPGWVALLAIKTSCGCITRHNYRGQTRAMWKLTDLAAHIWKGSTFSFDFWEELYWKFKPRRKRLIVPVFSRLSCDSWEYESWKCCKAACDGSRTWSRCFQISFSNVRSCRVLNVAKVLFGFYV